MLQARATALAAAAAATTTGVGGAGGIAPPFTRLGEPAAGGRERVPMDTTSSTFGAVSVDRLDGFWL